jgi:hypothetical protein
MEIAVPTFGSPVKPRDIRDLHSASSRPMIDAGLPIVQCLQILAAQTDSKPFRRVIGASRDDVESGTTLAEAIRSRGRSSPTSTRAWSRPVRSAVSSTRSRPASAAYLEKAGDAEEQDQGRDVLSVVQSSPPPCS